MNDLELDQQLRTTGDRWRSDFPAAVTFTESLAVAKQTSPRRVWLAPLVAAVAVVALVAGTVLITRAGHHSAPAAGPVPWSSATVPAPALSPYVAGGSGHQKCRNLGDFAIGPVNSALGPYTYGPLQQPVTLRIPLRYQGKTPCDVTKSLFLIQLLDDAGAVVGTSTYLLPGASLSLGPGTVPSSSAIVRDYPVEPGQTVIFASRWEDSCGSGKPTQLRLIGVGSTSSQALPLPADNRPICWNENPALALPIKALEPVVASPGSVDGLVASIHSPNTTKAGRLAFSVTITNLGDESVSLDPCPTYTITLGPRGVSTLPSPLKQVVVAHRLNCSHGPKRLTPGASSEWDMQVQTQAVRSGIEELSWDWGGQSEDDSRGTSTVLTIDL